MMINVNLATNRLQLETFVGGNLYSSVTYINIVAVSRGEDITRLVTAPTPSGAPTTATTQDDFIVRLHLADQLHVDLPLAYIANQPGWPNTQAGYEQAEIDIYAAFPTGGGGGGGLTGITGIPGITYAGTPTSVMTVSDAPDAREALGATINHGPYVAGLVVNFHDLVYERGVVYEWLGTQFTTTGVIANDLNWSVWGAVWQQKNRTLLQLVDTDAVNLDPQYDIYYITDAAGEADIADLGTSDVGAQFTVVVDPGSTFIKFAPVGTVDGVAATVSITSGTRAQFTSLGSGNWITTG